MDVAGLIRGAKLPVRTVMVCLRPDLVEPYEAFTDQLAASKHVQAKSDSMAAVPDLSEVTAQLREVEDEMRAATVPFILRALPRPRFRALFAAHPPRKDDDGNPLAADWNGVNQATFYEALIRACVVSPELDHETWRILLEEKLTDRQYEDLAQAAFDISRDKIDYPFLSGASRKTKDSVSG